MVKQKYLAKCKITVKTDFKRKKRVEMVKF